MNLMSKMRIKSVSASCGLLLLLTTSSVAMAPAATDLRVLIDISGSMKQNDPKNLRVPALRLLVGLLPEATEAGLWTFGKYVNMIVEHGPVTPEWKRLAQAASTEIRSIAMFTNIETALETATADWRGQPAQGERHLILLTDGMVDVSKDIRQSKLSRKRILESLLPELRKTGAKIHTLALSANADHELMRALAAATDGWYEHAASAEELERVFLHLFEKSLPRDALPLHDNQFTVDNSVEEVTLLLFRKAGAAPAAITAPDGVVLSGERPLPEINWHQEAGYDLVTIAKPAAGVWKISTAADPDNRALIITDLKMHTSKLPNHLLRGEALEFSAHFAEKDGPVTRADFLRMVDVSIEREESGGARQKWSLPYGADGYFRKSLGEGLDPGEYEYVVHADGKTFEREFRQTVKVYDQALDIDITPVRQKRGTGYFVVVKVAPELLDLATVKITATLTAPDHQTAHPPVEKLVDGEWQVALTELPAGQSKLTFAMQATTVNGRAIDLHADPVLLGEPPAAAEPATLEQGPAEDVQELAPADASGWMPADAADWIVVTPMVVVFNLLAAGIVAILVAALRRRLAPIKLPVEV